VDALAVTRKRRASPLSA